MLQYYLLLQGREFTADDYETLLQLDAPATHGRDAVEVGAVIFHHQRCGEGHGELVPSGYLT